MLARLLAVLVTVAVPLVILPATVAVSSTAYLLIRYGGFTWDTAALVEALNFSIQTITTVGYGNWATGLADRDPALLMLKLISLPTMIVGPAVFGLAISGLTNPAASEPSRRCPHCGAQLS